MAEKNLFDGKLIREPGSAAKTEGGVQNAGAPLDYGKICILDTGSGASYGGGKSSHDGAGTKLNKTDYINKVYSAREMRELVKGGILWDLADYIFNPANGAPGPSEVQIIHARQAAVGSVSIVCNATATMVISTKESGLNVNGSVGGVSELVKGYGWKLKAGEIDPAKYIFEFYIGTYPGVIGATTQTYGGISEAQAEAAPRLIVKSAEVTGFNGFEAWAENNADFQKYFTVTSNDDNGTTGLLAAADIVSFGSLDNLFAGGSESYNSTDLDDVLSDIGDNDNTFFLCDQYNADAAGTENVKILSHVVTEAQFKKFLIIGGSDNVTNMATQSKTPASTLDSRFAIVCHGGIEVPYELNPNLFIQKPSIYLAALVAGRLSGLQPQESITWKNLRVVKETHVLTQNERYNLLDAGVLHLKTVNGQIVVNQGVNTLQDNDYLINVDGSSHEISVERITAQLNRTLQEGAALNFVGQNIATASEADVIDYTESVLAKNMAIPGIQDGLILNYSNITATRNGSVWEVSYEFQANTPINKVFLTGTIIDPTL